LKKLQQDKPSHVLRQAAVYVRNGRYTGACAAINSQGAVDLEVRDRAHELFASIFRPEGYSDGEYWFGFSKHSNHRILAILLTADMAESVGD
jgi:hypothetical protein